MGRRRKRRRRRRLLGGRFGIRMKTRETEGIQEIWRNTNEKEKIGKNRRLGRRRDTGEKERNRGEGRSQGKISVLLPENLRAHLQLSV